MVLKSRAMACTVRISRALQQRRSPASVRSLILQISKFKCEIFCVRVKVYDRKDVAETSSSTAIMRTHSHGLEGLPALVLPRSEDGGHAARPQKGSMVSPASPTNPSFLSLTPYCLRH